MNNFSKRFVQSAGLGAFLFFAGCATGPEAQLGRASHAMQFDTNVPDDAILGSWGREQNGKSTVLLFEQGEAGHIRTTEGGEKRTEGFTWRRAENNKWIGYHRQREQLNFIYRLSSPREDGKRVLYCIHSESFSPGRSSDHLQIGDTQWFEFERIADL